MIRSAGAPLPAHCVRELLIVTALLQVLIWRPWLLAPEVAALRILTALGCTAPLFWLVARGALESGGGWRGLGLAPQQWRNGWTAIAALSAAGVVAILVNAFALGSFGDSALSLRWLGDYFLLIAAQQFLLQSYTSNRLWDAGSDLTLAQRHALVIGGTSFLLALAHIPNPLLMIGTGIAALGWTWHFRRYRNLPALIVSHLILGATAMAVLGNGPLLRLRVGLVALGGS